MDFPTETRSEIIDSSLWPHNSIPLAQILTEINQNVERMLKLIKDSKPESTEIFLCLYQSLGERYNDLNQELLNGLFKCSDSLPPELDMESKASYSSLKSHLASPEKKTRSSGEVEKNQSPFLLADIFRDELETALRDLETEKTQVLDLENKLSESSNRIEILESELEMCKECLGVSEAEVSKLTDMLSDCKAEKAKLQTDYDAGDLLDSLRAELSSREIQIEQMEEYLNQVCIKDTEIIMSESGREEELRGRVEELEKQVELQRNVISEREEEKREAIKELCFSLDHYKSNYINLVRSLSDNKKGSCA